MKVKKKKKQKGNLLVKSDMRWGTRLSCLNSCKAKIGNWALFNYIFLSYLERSRDVRDGTQTSLCISTNGPGNGSRSKTMWFQFPTRLVTGSKNKHQYQTHLSIGTKNRYQSRFLTGQKLRVIRDSDTHLHPTHNLLSNISKSTTQKHTHTQNTKKQKTKKKSF